MTAGTRAGLLLAILAGLAPGRGHADSVAYVGEIIAVGGSYCPAGFLPTDGRLLPITGHETLFQLIGTTYGGNGTSTFALPALPPAVTATGVRLTYCIALDGLFPSQ